MPIQGQITEQDFIDAQKLAIGQTKMYIVGIVLICVLFDHLGRIISALEQHIQAPTFSYAVVIAFSLYLFLQFVILPQRLKKSFVQNKELKLPFELDINDNGMVITNALSTSRKPWNFFLKWRDNSKILLLYQTDNCVIILPKRLFTEEQLQFLQSKIPSGNPPKALAIRKRTAIIAILIIILIIVMAVYNFQQRYNIY